MKLTKNRCKCTHCGEHFTTLRGFDRHRKGSFRDRGAHRRCLTVDEMQERGWHLNPQGFWVAEKRRRAIAAWLISRSQLN